MFLLPLVFPPGTAGWIEALADTSILALTAGPLLFWRFQRHHTGQQDRLGKAIAERTEHLKQTNAGLQVSEHRLRAILEAEPECVKLVAADGTLLEMNPAGLRMIEADRTEHAVGRSVYDLVAPEHRETFQALNAAVFRGESQVAEYEIVGLKGTRRWLRTHACPLRDLEGKIVAQLGVTSDITAYRESEEKLRLAEAKFRGIVEQLPAITYHADLGETCKWSYVSPQITPLLGYTQAEWLASDRLWFEQIHPEDCAIPIEAEAAGVRTGRMCVEYRMFTRQGQVRWFRDQGVFVAASPGHFTIFGVMLDITEAKAAEAELADAHRKLLDTSRRAGMADVASSVLHNVGNVLNSVNISTSQIATALRGSAVGDVGRVAGLLAGHEADLAAYLTADPKGRQIPSFLGRLASALTEERAANLAEVETLASNVDHLKQIIAMQQGIARAGGVWEPVTLPELFEQALAINLASIGRHGIEIIREFADLPPVVTDRHQVLQVLVNLISNAKYAMLAADNPVKCLTLRAQAHAARPDFYLMEVSDTGTGIAPEHLPRIFTQGFTTKQEGHGFGLHSCALAAQALGGALTVRSAGPGCGATFTLRLPAHDRTLAAAA